MGKRYDLLARHYVELAGPSRTEQEVMALLRARTRRIRQTELVPQLA
jgi:uncharacterized membrane protein